MPKILDRLVKQLEAKGMGKSQAFAVATNAQQKAGNLKAGSHELTAQGKVRQAMGAAGRAKDRAAKAAGRNTKDYSYASRTNRATLKG